MVGSYPFIFSRSSGTFFATLDLRVKNLVAEGPGGAVGADGAADGAAGTAAGTGAGTVVAVAGVPVAGIHTAGSTSPAE
eukprot:CAMPEP_0175101536 /NCGR_PEP_ID=MMETSP0086_2-20121207/7871_1 /TAXON_ID=136419 /ORGANISM="Unknown Unknown, Strain D1" /LENGTH=78 /DNA_ID=CAMNT_0016376117 /DNA_START=350 /DNA_END=584 /DNA_ORIENTATION=-